MNRLQSELQRLYLPESQVGANEGVRAMVMELAGPPSWVLLARVWHGVQAELELPAPAIAVSGIDGLQLWFSVAEPIAIEKAHAFLELLRVRFLGDVKPGRVRLTPSAGASAMDASAKVVSVAPARPQRIHPAPVPALQEATGNWSAFVAPDLAPVFADTPWLDLPPNEEGQATLLRGLQPMKPAAFEAALNALEASIGRTGVQEVAAPARVAASRAADDVASVDRAQTASAASNADPRRFLLRVMNDETAPLALRIEAAKALLPH